MITGAESLQLARAQIAALPPEPRSVGRQHTVTKRLLREWETDVRGQRLVHRISVVHPGRSRNVGVNGCGYVPDFVQHRSESLESYWKTEIEDHLGGALQSVSDRTVLSSPEHRLTILKTFALHMARSRAFAVIHKRVSDDVMSQARHTYWNTPGFLEHLFYMRYGLYPAGLVARELILEDLVRPTEELIRTGEYMRVRLPDLYQTGLATLTQPDTGLTLFHAPDGNVAIGDTPALAVQQGPDGVLTGAPIKYFGHGALLLPLGPEWIAVLGAKDGYAEAPPGFVRDSNRLQVDCAEDHVVMRCGMWPARSDQDSLG